MLGSIPVQLYRAHDPYTSGPERFTASTSGRFLAGQSGTCLTVFQAPECTLYLQLEISASPLWLVSFPRGVHIFDVCWSPDDTFIICSMTDSLGYSLCSLAGKCWQHPNEGWDCDSAEVWTPQEVSSANIQCGIVTMSMSRALHAATPVGSAQPTLLLQAARCAALGSVHAAQIFDGWLLLVAICCTSSAQGRLHL